MPDGTISSFPLAPGLTDTTVFGGEEFDTAPTQRYPVSLLRTFILTTGAFPTGGVIFAGATGDLTSDSSTFFWDDTNKQLHIGGSISNLSAILEIESTTKGVLIPRMTTAQRDAIATPAPSLLVFNISTESYDFYNTTAAAWNQLVPLDRFTTFTSKTPAAATDEFLINDGGTLKKTTSAGIVGATGVTKTIQFPLPSRSADDGAYRVLNITTSGSANITFYIPYDFGSLTSLEVVFYPSAPAAGAGKDIDLTSEYGQIGENKAFHSESDTTSVYNLGATDILGTYSIASVFSSITAGDQCGLTIKQNAVGGTVRYLFGKMVYITG